MKHYLRSRFQPRLEALEERCTPSANSSLVNGHHTTSVFARPSLGPAQPALVTAPSSQAIAAAEHQVPFKEHLTVVAVSSTGVISYEGKATHFGRVTAVLNPDNTFIKTAANGDTAFGYVTPASATTGTLTFTGGTGRFEGA